MWISRSWRSIERQVAAAPSSPRRCTQESVFGVRDGDAFARHHGEERVVGSFGLGSRKQSAAADRVIRASSGLGMSEPSQWKYNVFMGAEKTLRRLLSGTADAAIRFDDLCQLLERLGFEKLVRGSHHLFRQSGVEERINLQRGGTNAKPYQVKQVRAIILKYKLGSKQ